MLQGKSLAAIGFDSDWNIQMAGWWSEPLLRKIRKLNCTCPILSCDELQCTDGDID